ncbi:DUF4878 domain-containing protein [Mycobacterium sp. MS1601]|uniref:Rv0361 family membrane protein n=1 Tax=Mycobacterium sp. MS1601 TaxID=1936029 RepID=UPI000979465F|nr:DUF4878 domain-containing protein [Mycobacterium sp. MS1601]AQA03794.1 DUF4878 domain-containing protein [Mycobacterium sp. MS1601]
MSDPSGPDQDASGTGSEADTETTQAHDEPATEVFAAADQTGDQQTEPAITPGERRYTAPSGMDAGSTQIIGRTPDEPATEVFAPPTDPAFAVQGAPRPAGPQTIPPRTEVPKIPGRRRSWGWVIAVILVIAALAAIAILATVLLTRSEEPVASQEDKVRETIQSFDTAIQNGDLATLRSVTCGSTAESYIKYDDRQWKDTHSRVAAAKQYPVVASIDQVVVNGDHAEANVTSFMAFDPSTRSTRSFDLEFRDNSWKICQSPQ